MTGEDLEIICENIDGTLDNLKVVDLSNNKLRVEHIQSLVGRLGYLVPGYLFWLHLSNNDVTKDDVSSLTFQLIENYFI